MICPYCGTQNRNMAKFCDSCGSELPTVAPDAREMFDDDRFLIEGQDALTVDLQGLERMVDSSNSGEMYERAGEGDIYLDGGSSSVPAIYDEPYATTVPLDATSVMGVADSSANDGYTQEPYTEDGYATRTIPLVAAKPFKTAEFTAVSASSTGHAKTTSTDALAGKVFSAESSKSASSKKKKIIIGVVVALVLALAAAAALVAYNLQLWGGISIPDVVRQTEGAATTSLQEAGFSVDVDYVVSDDVGGIVVSTMPSAGTRAQEGSVVVISVSIPRVIPEILGLTQQEALDALNESGYTDVEFITQKSNEAEGTVISSDPAIGVQAVADTHVQVVIAEPYRVPSVEGLTRDEAVAALEAEGYVVKTTTYITEDIEEGMAVSTDPVAGSVLPSGSEVVLSIAHNRSKELIEATKAYFAGASQFSINGMNYEIGEVKSVTYQGSDTCAYTITARPFETHTWLFGDTETRYGNYETINGTITFNADNSIKSTDPVIKRLG